MDELKTNFGCLSGCLGMVLVIFGIILIIGILIFGLYFLSVL